VPFTVLVVEDELKLRNVLRSFLEREGIAVVTASTGAEAIDLGTRLNPDLVVLDLGLPDVSGLDVARELRRDSDVPVLMLTAMSSDDDRIRGLESGADDYLTKPFSPRELVLRVQALLRRGRMPSEPITHLSFGQGQLVVDEDRHELRVGGELVALSPTEWGILLELSRVPGRVYSRYELVNAVRGYEWEGYERVIDSHVKNLRRKLKDSSAHPHVIETVLGVGYRLCLKRDPA
jgi:DNA-binding response OmpR family regulator